MIVRRIMALILTTAALSAAGGCQFSHEKEKELDRMNAEAHDSTRHAVNPYKTGQDTKVYDQQREVVGNIDTLVTPQDPGIPGR